MKLAMSVTPTKFGGTACLRFEAACLRFCLRTYVVVLWCEPGSTMRGTARVRGSTQKRSISLSSTTYCRRCTPPLNCEIHNSIVVSHTPTAPAAAHQRHRETKGVPLKRASQAVLCMAGSDSDEEAPVASNKKVCIVDAIALTIGIDYILQQQRCGQSLSLQEA